MSTVHDFKVVVAGPFAAGKTTRINAISDAPVVGTEKPTTGPEAMVKDTTTVGMEHGRYSIADGDDTINLYLYGVPGQTRFSFMWDIAGEGLDGLVILVDSTKPDTWAEAIEVGRHFTEQWTVPVVIAANRTKDPEVLEQLRAVLAVPGATYVMCDVTDASSAAGVLVEVLIKVLEAMDGSGQTEEIRAAVGDEA